MKRKNKVTTKLNNSIVWKRLLFGCIECGEIEILQCILNYKEKSGKLSTNYATDETVLNLCIENSECVCDEIVSHFGNGIKWEYINTLLFCIKKQI